MLANYCKFFIDGVISEDQFHKMYFQTFSQNKQSIPDEKPISSEFDKITLKNGKKVQMPPFELSVEISEKDNYLLRFPLELTNLDYIRRILDFLQDGLKIFITQIRIICSETDNYEQDDVFYLLKWMKKNASKWIPLVGQSNESMIVIIEYLLSIRNSFAHQNKKVEHSKKGKLNITSKNNVIEVFQTADKLLSILSASLSGRNFESIQFCLRNITNLEYQFECHSLWKKKRKINIFEKVEKTPQKETIPQITKSFADSRESLIMIAQRKKEESVRKAKDKEEKEELEKRQAQLKEIERNKTIQEIHKIIMENGISFLGDEIDKIIEETGFDFKSPYLINDLNFENITTIKKNGSDYQTCFAIKDDFLFIGHQSSKIVIYDTIKNEQIGDELFAPAFFSGSIYRIIPVNNLIYVGYSGGKIGIWNFIERKIIENSIIVRQVPFPDFVIIDNKIIFIGYSIYIIDIDTKNTIFTFSCSEFGIKWDSALEKYVDVNYQVNKVAGSTAIFSSGKTFYTAMTDGLIRKWNIDTVQLINPNAIENVVGYCKKDTKKIIFYNDSFYTLMENSDAKGNKCGYIMKSESDKFGIFKTKDQQMLCGLSTSDFYFFQNKIFFLCSTIPKEKSEKDFHYPKGFAYLYLLDEDSLSMFETNTGKLKEPVKIWSNDDDSLIADKQILGIGRGTMYIGRIIYNRKYSCSEISLEIIKENQ